MTWCKAQAGREDDAYKLATYTAWETAAFTRQKKLPTLKKALAPFDNGKQGAKLWKQSPEMLRQKIQALNMAFGGKDLTQNG